MLRRTFQLSSAALGGNKKTADICIIGAGIIGSYTALELAKAFPEKRVIVVDENPRVGAGSTCHSSGIIRAFYSVRETARLAWESYAIWENIQDYLQISNNNSNNGQPVATMRKVNGFLQTSQDSAAFLNNFLAVAKELNIPIEHLDSEVTRKYCDSFGWNARERLALRRVDADDFATPIETGCSPTSIVVPNTGYVADPGLAVQNAKAAAVARAKTPQHLEFLCNSRVTAITKNKSGTAVAGVKCVSVSGDTFTIDCGAVINCAGPASSVVTAMAFDDKATVASDNSVNTKALRAEVAIVPMPKSPSVTTNQVIAFDVEAGFYIRPEGQAHYCVGGLDLPGDPIPFDYTVPEETRSASEIKLDDDGGKGRGHSFIPGEQAMIHISRMAVRMQQLEIPSSPRFVTSYYDVADDWSPIVDGSSLGGYYQAIGTSGNCFKIAPLIARLVVAAMQGEESITLPLTTPKGVSPAFKREVFARNRAPLEESTNSVIG